MTGNVVAVVVPSAPKYWYALSLLPSEKNSSSPVGMSMHGVLPAPVGREVLDHICLEGGIPVEWAPLGAVEPQRSGYPVVIDLDLGPVGRSVDPQSFGSVEHQHEAVPGASKLQTRRDRRVVPALGPTLSRAESSHDEIGLVVSRLHGEFADNTCERAVLRERGVEFAYVGAEEGAGVDTGDVEISQHRIELVGVGDVESDPIARPGESGGWIREPSRRPRPVGALAD